MLALERGGRRNQALTETIAIDVDGVTKSYTPGVGAPVLRGMTLRVARGECVALMGASGSGKTTLLNLIGGLDVPDAGRVLVDGADLSRLSDAERSAFRLRRIGFVFQFFNLLPHLTALENIALPLLLLGRGEAEARAAATALGGEVGLDGKLDRPPNRLSGGEMQRVALARALAHGPAVLLADEPTGNLDSITGKTVLALLREEARRHDATVLIATHDADAAAIADRVVHIRDGQIVEEEG